MRAPAPKCNAAIKIRNPRQLNYSIRAERKEKKNPMKKKREKPSFIVLPSGGE